MPVIQLRTSITASIEICFDLSRSIDLHRLTMSHTKEKAVAGVTSGLIGKGDFVTWEATHFGITQKLTSKITAFNRPYHFRDEQLKGAFKYIIHDHTFEESSNGALMKDVFSFDSPLGILGKAANLILKCYLTKLLTQRNTIIKEYAESEKWKSILNEKDYSSSAKVST